MSSRTSRPSRWQPPGSNPVTPAAPGTLKRTLESGRFVLAPGVFEMFSAKLADRMDFAALYMTGYGISGSHLGQADAGLVGFRDMVERARTIAQGISRPLIADADTGFGGLINVRQAVRGYEEAGVQAIQIEDQEMPKKCGHTPNRRVVPLRDAVQRIEVAVDSRRSSDFLVIARTDDGRLRGDGADPAPSAGPWQHPGLHCAGLHHDPPARTGRIPRHLVFRTTLGPARLSRSAYGGATP